MFQACGNEQPFSLSSELSPPAIAGEWMRGRVWGCQPPPPPHAALELCQGIPHSSEEITRVHPLDKTQPESKTGKELSYQLSGWDFTRTAMRYS